jgi:membrane protease YdiL (CAAX protease family)
VKEVLLAQSTSSLQALFSIIQIYAAAIALLGVVVAAGIYLLWRPQGVPRVLVGPQRWPAVPWMLPEVLLSCAILLFLVEVLMTMTPLVQRRLDPAVYDGFQVPAALGLVAGPYDGGLAAGVTSFVGTLTAYPAELLRRINEMRTLMIAQIVMLPFLIYMVVSLMRRVVNAQPYQLGLHMHRWRENVTLGCIGWAITTPLIVLIFLFVKLEFWETLWGRPTVHPIGQLLSISQSPWTWTLAALVTCVVAPMKEEVLLRGIVQPYLVRWPIAADIMVLVGVGMAIMSLFNPGTMVANGAGMGPFLFVAAVAVGYSYGEVWLRRWLPDPGVFRGIFATSLFFAFIHAGAWPTPIPIFALSMVLGVLAYRTGSLVGPITMHALFNATTMLFSYLSGASR